MPPPQPGGIGPSDIVILPQAPGGTNTIFAVAEQPTSLTLMYYAFDFTRQATLAFNNPSSPELSYFKHMRFGKGRMSMTRIDTGGNVMVGVNTGANGATAAPIPFTFGSKPTLVRVHYLRLPNSESTSADWSVAVFLADRRRRSRVLRQGRSLSWSFSATANTYRHMQTVERTAGAPGLETDTIRDVTIPTRQRRLGWIPTGVAAAMSKNTNFQAAGSSGLNPSINRILGSTILFMFETDVAAPYSIAIPTPATTLNIQNASFPLISRSESCRIFCKGMRDNTTLQVGAMLPVVAYPTTTHPMFEKASFSALEIGSEVFIPGVTTATAGQNYFATVPGPLTAAEPALP